MAEQPYKRSPITEAVIHVVFSRSLSPSDFEKVNRSFTHLYPLHQTSRNVTAELAMPPRADQDPITRVANDELGHRRSSDDQTQILIIWPASLVFSQLAPIRQLPRDDMSLLETLAADAFIEMVNNSDIPIKSAEPQK